MKLNRITLLKEVRNNTPEILFVGSVVVFSVLLCFKLPPLFALGIGCFVAVLGFRLFFGKLHIKEGDVVLFWGLPGSGKTMFQNVVAAYNKKKHGSYIVGNEEFAATSQVCQALLPRNAFGFFKPPEGSIICTDEASLNGWDNRDWAKNFNSASLAFWKKIRHYHCAAILTNQGFGELDCKIRDSLTSTVYYVENHGRYSKAIRMDKDVTFSEVTGLPQEGYKMPSIWQRLIDPSCVLYVWHSVGGKLFRSFNPDPLPDLDTIDAYVYVDDKKRGCRWVLRTSAHAADESQGKGAFAVNGD